MLMAGQGLPALSWVPFDPAVSIAVCRLITWRIVRRGTACGEEQTPPVVPYRRSRLDRGPAGPLRVRRGRNSAEWLRYLRTGLAPGQRHERRAEAVGRCGSKVRPNYA